MFAFYQHAPCLNINVLWSAIFSHPPKTTLFYYVLEDDTICVYVDRAKMPNTPYTKQGRIDVPFTVTKGETVVLSRQTFQHMSSRHTKMTSIVGAHATVKKASKAHIPTTPGPGLPWVVAHPPQFIICEILG